MPSSPRGKGKGEPSPLQVLVTGASGQTGVHVVRALLAQPGAFTPAVTVRSEAAARAMLALGLPPRAVFGGVDLAGGEQGAAALRAALAGRDALVICSSAVPRVAWAPTLLGGARAWLAARLGRADVPFVPVVTWKAGQAPEAVDWLGQRAQIDAAAACGVGHVVLVSSAGGCDAHHFLNHIGGGDMLNWKRRAEQHLIASGLTYTILHPNHLVDRPAGRHVVVLGVDDSLQAPHWRERLKMPRADLAALAVAALALRDRGAGNRSVDVAARPARAGEAATTTLEQFAALFGGMNANCSYAINDRTAPGAAWACSGPGAADAPAA
ncbi:SARED1 [Scenedesmus sp. PABB004]|nr:SARED1 [Scenedesmus sp. PABB004]